MRAPASARSPTTASLAARSPDADAGQPVRRPGRVNPTPPSAEGGALRAQDMRTSGDPQTLDGAVIRIDPDSGAAWPTNAGIGQSDANARRIIAYGLRNPYPVHDRPVDGPGLDRRCGFQHLGGAEPADGSGRGPDATSAGRATRERPSCRRTPAWDLSHLRQPRSVGRDAAVLRLQPRRPSSRVTAAGPAARRSPGLAFLPDTSPYPAADHGALFMTDYTRRCIWEIPAGSNGQPDVSARRLFANLRRPGSELDGGSVYLAIAPTGDLVYADYDRGEIRRIHYYGSNVPPVASFTATPVVRPCAASRRVRRQRFDRWRQRSAHVRLGPRRRRPVRRCHRRDHEPDLLGRWRRRGRPAGLGRHPHPDDQPDRVGRQCSRPA